MTAEIKECFGHGHRHHRHHRRHRHHHRRPRIINWVSDWATPVRYTPPVIVNNPEPKHKLLDIHTNLLVLIVVILVIALLIMAFRK